MRTHLVGLALLGAGAMAAAAPVIVEPVFGAEFRGVVTPLWILLGGVVANALGSPDGRALLAQGRVEVNFAASALAAALNLGANFALIPSYGLEGAAWATAGTQLVWSLAVIWLARRWTPPNKSPAQGAPSSSA
jgi:O-antigen/teichoic acid export membrane protein